MDLLGGFAVDDARRDFHAFDLAGNDINALMLGAADPPMYDENDNRDNFGNGSGSVTAFAVEADGPARADTSSSDDGQAGSASGGGSGGGGGGSGGGGHGFEHAGAFDYRTAGGARRPKAKRVCVRCRACKTVCDDERPCQRCVRLGISDGCVDAGPRHPRRAPTDAGAAGRPKRHRVQSPKAEAGTPASATGRPGGLDADSLASWQGYMESSPAAAAGSATQPDEAQWTVQSPPPNTNIVSPLTPLNFGDGKFLERVVDHLATGQRPPAALVQMGAAVVSALGEDKTHNITGLIMNRLDASRIHKVYFQWLRQEVLGWHARVIQNSDGPITPMYLMFLHHFFEIARRFKYLTETQIEEERAVLQQGIPAEAVEHVKKFQDNTPLQPSDAATAEERALNRLYKHLPIGIIKVTNDRFVMRITFANAYIEKITGLSMEEIVAREGLFIPTVVQPTSMRVIILALLSSIVSRQDVFQVRCHCVHFDGTVFEAIVTAQMDFDGGLIPTTGTVYIQKITP